MALGENACRRARAGLPVAIATALCLALAPWADAAPLARSGEGDLSPRLAELAKPALRAAPPAAQAAALGLASQGPGSLLRRGDRVLLDVRFAHGAASGVDDLRAAGAEVVSVSRRYQTVTVAVRPAGLPHLERLAGVRAVTEVLAPIVRGTSAFGPGTAAYMPCFGLETSEGDEQLRAAEARAEFEVEGDGVKVGVLSDSFDRDPFAPTGAAEDVASGDLPGPGNPCGHATPVEVLEDLGPGKGGEDEGRAMAQIVHDLAPGAALSFATAFNGETSFANNIRALESAGAKALVDDVSYLEEPFFQEGPIGVAVSEVTAGEDVAYFSAAGNDNLIDGEGNDIGSWEAPSFRDSGSCPSPVAALGPAFNPSHCMDFDPGVGIDPTFGITVSSGETLVVDLQWAEPWGGIASDLDAFLLNPAGGKMVAASANQNVVRTQRPLEIVAWENRTGAAATVQLAINRFAGVSPRLKFILSQNGGGVTAIEYPKSSGGDVVGPTIFGHNGGEDAMSTGAIRYTTKSAPELFSSRGPVTHYFGPVSNITPAPPFGSPQVLAKPDVLATDGGASAFFGSCVGGAWRFFGTSAAAPHAAAVAALERGAEPAADAAKVEGAQREAAVPIAGLPATVVGSGLLDAVGALEALGVTPPSPGAAPAEAPPPGPCLPPRKPASPASTASPTGTIADDTAPQTFFRRHPPNVLRTFGRTARATFRFGSNEDDVVFACRMDGGLMRFCGERLARRFSAGRHALRVTARDGAGNVDETPAVYRFRVKRIG
jgi:hypothetical protein